MPSFRLQYTSNLFVDLHKQKYDTLIKPVCSTLALLGNIGHPQDARTYHFLNYCSRNWDKTLWVSGSHELLKTPTDRLSYSKGLAAVNTLSEEFPNVRCLDSKEEVFSSDNTILLGLPPDLPSMGQKFYRSKLTHTMLRTAFWSMTHPLANIVFLTSTATEKNLTSAEGSTLETPTFLWLVGDSPKNILSTDSQSKQFFVTNSCFANARLRKLPSYSPTAIVEIVHPDSSRGDGEDLRVSLRDGKQSLQLA